jgi:hypothetical protein
MALTLVQLSGMGLSLVGTTIEQDAAYWEVHIDVPDDDKGTAYEVMFGVATKKDRKFFNALAELEEGRWCGVVPVWSSKFSFSAHSPKTTPC